MQIRERYPLPEKANIIMDTTYFGRSFGVMVLMDSISQQALSVDEVKYETNALYGAALNELREKALRNKALPATGERDYYRCFPRFPRNCASFTRSKLSAVI